VKPVYINTWQYNIRSSLLTELLIQLGCSAPRKGKPVDELLSKLREWLDKNRGVAVATDEFDQLEEDAEVVYDLQLLNQEADHHIGTILVSNKPPVKRRCSCVIRVKENACGFSRRMNPPTRSQSTLQ
jgi:cell division control protein 6